MRSNIYAFLIFLIVGTIYYPAAAQFTWQQIGPDNTGTITRALAFDDSENIWAGSQNGGLWRSTNLGESWERVSAYAEAGCNLNITSIAVNGNTIYVSTGAAVFASSFGQLNFNYPADWDYRAENSGFKGYIEGHPGGGVYVSTDNGQTWKVENATNNESSGTARYQGDFTDVPKVTVSGNRALIGTRGGLYYSDDALETVTKVSGSDFFESSIVFDIEVAENNTIFVSVHDDVSSKDSLYVSTDNGTTFSPIVDPILFEGDRIGFNRAEIAVAPSDRNIVYVATTQANQEVNGVFRFDLRENEWRRIGFKGLNFTPLGTNGRDAITMTVFPNNPNELILAGQSWYTYTEDESWQLGAQSVFPDFASYLEGPIYSVAFLPSNPNIFMIGTRKAVYRSSDRGKTFAQRTRGYNVSPVYSVTSFDITSTDAEGGVTALDVVVGGTQNANYIFNSFYNSEKPSKFSYGSLDDPTINSVRFGEIAASTLYPGSLIAQGEDGGVLRSLNFGEAFERFYGVSQSPQVANLTPVSDTLIDRANANSPGEGLNNNPTPAQTIWVLDEFFPANFVENQDVTLDEAQTEGEVFVFLASRNYVWLGVGAFGDGLQVKWNRLTPPLVDGFDEVFTAMTVAQDGSHTVYVASSKGNLWRLDSAANLSTFDADADITQLNADIVSSGLFNTDTWISDLAVDPSNPDRLVLTYAGYGAAAAGTARWLWATDNARADVPGFGGVSGINAEPIYCAEYVVDPETQESILMIGTESSLFSVRDLRATSSGPPPLPIRYAASATDELEGIGNVAVYDVFERKYSVSTIADGLTRREIRDTDSITLQKDQILINNDKTLFIATRGLGIWTSASLKTQRQGNPTSPQEPINVLDVNLFPNPTTDLATLRVDLPQEANVDFELFNLNGQLIYGSGEGQFDAGRREWTLNTSQLAPGMYLVKVNIRDGATEQERTLKLAITR
ncbi:MAG: T9SS type A sorting domain-containing protein [Bacteroidota bacterium]